MGSFAIRTALSLFPHFFPYFKGEEKNVLEGFSGGEKVSRRHRWVSGVARLGVGGGAREAGAPEGAAVRRLWGGAVCEGRA